MLDALRIPVRPMAVQVIEVPKILIDVIPARSLVPEPQTAEQLVEVPTVLSPTRIALQIAEQIVDTPVPQGLGGKRRVPGLTATSSSLERISERTVEQFVDIPVPAGGGLHGIRLDPGGPSSSAVLRHERGHRDLGTFAHDVKSARSAGSSSARVHPHSSSWTLASCEAEEHAYPDFECQFFDFRGLSWVRRWIPSWSDRGWNGPFTRAEWDIVTARDDDGAGSAGWRRQGGRDWAGFMRQSTGPMEVR